MTLHLCRTLFEYYADIRRNGPNGFGIFVSIPIMRVPELQFSCNENMEYMELSKDRVRFA